MKRASLYLLLLVLLGVSTLAWGPTTKPALLLAAPQSPTGPPSRPSGSIVSTGEPTIARPAPPRPPEDFEDDPNGAKPQRKAMNTAQAEKDAQELAALAAKIQGDVDQLSKHVLPKDLDQELKQVQKVAKHLRGEIAP